MVRPLALTVCVCLATPPAAAQTPQDTRLPVRHLSVSSSLIAFSYSGDLWVVDRSGGAARQLTSGAAEDDFPAFAPDGGRIAFSRRGADDWDVYVLAVDGGDPVRLTYNPEADIARGWTPDGERVLFMSHRDEEGIFRLYTVSARGGFPSALPVPRGHDGAYSPDERRLAYVPYALPLELTDVDWRYYRGGMSSPIWIANLRNSEIDRIPRGDTISNERTPIWLGNTIYFVSDRDGVFNLHAYDTFNEEVQPVTSYAEFGITAAAGGGDVVAFVRDGRIHVYEPSTGAIRNVDVTVDPDTSETATRTVAGARWIQSATLAPDGDRVLFGARGDVVLFEVAADSARNLTGTSGAAERHPTMSPDGRWIAYFSDESGEYRLRLRRTDGSDGTKEIPIEIQPTYYTELTWSPDSKKLAFADKALSLWVSDVETGGSRRAATSEYAGQPRYQPSWSPDSRLLAYTLYDSKGIGSVQIYEVQTARNHPVTDGRAHAESPAFDGSGHYLFLTTSPTAAAGDPGWGVLSGVMFRPLVSRRLSVAVLEEGQTAPTLPFSGDPHPGRPALEPTDSVAIEFEGLTDRVVPLPPGARDFTRLVSGPPGVVYALVTEWPESSALGQRPTGTLYRYDLDDPRELQQIVTDVDEFRVSADGASLLFRRDREWSIVPGAPGSTRGARRLDTDAVRVTVEPRSEWRQIFHEAWRLMRDLFHDPEHHDQDIERLEEHFATYLPAVARRADLNYLIGQMLGHISVSHLAVRGGDIPEPSEAPTRVGLLGADYVIDDGVYRFERIYGSGHPSNPSPLLRAPLDQPGVTVEEGEYLLAVDGRPVRAPRNIFSYFQGTAGQPVKIRVGPEKDGDDSRTLTVVPVPGENTLRRANWAERNRVEVLRESRGRLAYIYVPDYGSGLEVFVRDLLAYRERPGLIIDQRFAPGGLTADYIIEWLDRRSLYDYSFRNGRDIDVPLKAVPGKKVLLVNEMNASAAETFALMFKLGELGQIVGTRTMGAGIGPQGSMPELIDGGRITIPSRAAQRPDESYLENEGVTPDVEVEWLPEQWREGRDPQLARAIEVALDALAADTAAAAEPKTGRGPRGQRLTRP